MERVSQRLQIRRKMEIIKILFQIIGIGVVLAYWSFCIKFGLSRIKNVVEETHNIYYEPPPDKDKESTQ